MHTQQGETDASAPTNANAFVPGKRPFRSQNGMEVTLDAIKKYNPQLPTVPIPSASPVVTGRRATSIRIESEETKRLREEALRNGCLRREEEECIEVQQKAAKRDISAPLPSSLPTVRVIENLSEVVYPEGIKRPNVELNNANVTNGRFRYDREFLMQFMHICMEKPPTLPPLNVLGIEPVNQSSFALARGSGRHHKTSSAMPHSAVGLAIGSFQKPSVLGPFQTGNLLSTGSKLTIQERLLSSPGGKGNSRTRTKRGNTNKTLLSQQGQDSGFGLSIPTDVSEADAKKRVDEYVKEFFAAHNLEKADVYFINLPREHRFRLVEKLVAFALERKEADARLVGEFFARAASNEQCTLEVFEEGFMPMTEMLDDISIDAPKAFDYMAIMLKGAGFGEELKRLQRITSKLEDNDKLFSLVATAENEFYNRQASMSRGGSRRSGDRDQEYGPDGWAVAGSPPSRPPPNPKASDLSQFGKVSKDALMVMGPSSVFAGAKKDSKRESLSRTSSNSNMFQMLSQNPEPTPEPSAKHNRLTSRKPSIDLGQAGVPEPPIQRKKLQLLPRSKPTAEETTPVPSDDELESAPTDMSEADAKKKIDEDVKEFFAIRNLEEADVYFADLPHEHRFRLVDKLVASALERKEADARLVGELFARAESNELCTLEVFEKGFMPMAEFLDDTAIDAPMAFDNMAIMLRGAGFEKDPERLERIASKLEDNDKLFSLVATAENEFCNRQASMSSGGSRHGGDRDQEYGPDGWAVAGGPPSRSPPNPMVMGQSSVFAGGKKDSKRESIGSNTNMFLGQNPIDQRPEALALRKKLQRLPRFKPSTSRQTAED